MKSQTKPHVERLVLFAMVLIYVSIFSYASIQQHNAYNTTLYDLGIFDQVIWNTAHGRFFESSIKGFNFLGDHFSPILILISPLYHIWSDARLLLVLQTLLLAVGAFPIYMIARREFKEGTMALVFAFVYLAYPALGYLNMFDFHPIAISVPFLTWSFYFFKTRRWRAFYFCITGALLCKEEIAIIVAFLGIFIWIKTADFKRGISVFSLGLFYFILVMFFIIPKIGEGQFLYYVRYPHLGTNIWEIIRTIFLHPIYSLRSSFILRKLANFIFIFLALGFTPFFSPTYLLVILPPMAYSYLSLYPLQFDIRYQYTAPMIPFLIFASLYGTKNILSWIRNHLVWRKIFLCLLLSLVVCASSFQIILPLRQNPLTPRASYQEILQAGRLIPESSSLTTGISLGAHFSQRRIIKEYVPAEEAATEFIFIDLNRDSFWSEDKECFFEAIIKIIQDKNYGIIYFNNGILLLKMGAKKDRIKEVMTYMTSHRGSNLPPETEVVSFIKELLKIKNTSSP